MRINGKTFSDSTVTTKIKRNGSYTEPRELYKNTNKIKNKNTTNINNEEMSISEKVSRALNKKYIKKD